MTLRKPANQDIVVFGASGDLASRKLLPALYNLSAEGLLPATCDIVGVAPMAWGDTEFRNHARQAVKANSRTGLDEAAFKKFVTRLRFVDNSASPSDLGPLAASLPKRRRLMYLAVPSSVFGGLIGALGGAGLAADSSLIIEKPFGHDLESARQLNGALHAVLPEDRIYRIDHYMGKETVQNVMVFRFGNAIFERLWNRDAISKVEITVAESLGVENRGAFYEETGAIRDIVQNHIFQVLSVIAMEPPASFDAEAIRNEKVKVLQSLHPIDPAHVVRGQYTAGTIDGNRVVGYTSEPGVAANSSTETFAALKLQLDSWRWSGVPFLLRTGKRMAQRDTRVVITFRDVPLQLFKGHAVGRVAENRLVLRIQPDEGIAVHFVAKQPGPQLRTQDVRMDFSYGTSFKTSPPEAYERLLHDALLADHTLFIREDEVEHGWAAVQPVLDSPPPISKYAAGSWGPKDSVRLAGRGGWFIPSDG